MPARDKGDPPQKGGAPKPADGGMVTGAGLTLHTAEPKPSLYTEPLISLSDFEVSHKTSGGTVGGSLKVSEDGEFSIALGFLRYDSKHGFGLTAGLRVALGLGKAGGFDYQVMGGEIYRDGHWALGPKFSIKVTVAGASLTLVDLKAQTTRDATVKLGARVLSLSHETTVQLNTARVHERLDARIYGAMVDWGVPMLP